jgi:hypothetical protein
MAALDRVAPLLCRNLRITGADRILANLYYPIIATSTIIPFGHDLHIGLRIYIEKGEVYAGGLHRKSVRFVPDSTAKMGRVHLGNVTKSATICNGHVETIQMCRVGADGMQKRGHRTQSHVPRRPNILPPPVHARGGARITIGHDLVISIQFSIFVLY